MNRQMKTARISLAIGCGLVLSLMVSPVLAAEELTELDDVVVTGTKTEKSLTDVPVRTELIMQAVMEHVADPERCVAEALRVLTPHGLVYAETPFMQQVHGSPYDFRRFTYLGHRQLFRGFRQLSAGPLAGPATALAWAWEAFLTSFSDRVRVQFVLRRIARLSGFWIKHFDRCLTNRRSAWDCASAYFFMGQKSPDTLSDTALIAQFGHPPGGTEAST